jgi:hypothetical protein
MAAAHVAAIQPDDPGGRDRIGFKWWRICSGERYYRGTDPHGAVPDRPRVHSATDREKFEKSVPNPCERYECRELRRDIGQFRRHTACGEYGGKALYLGFLRAAPASP